MKFKRSYIIVGVLIPIAAIIAGLTNKELRCLLRLDFGSICHSYLINVQLVVRNSKYEPIQGVEVRFLSEGAPEVEYTDSNGYVRIQIPGKKDIEITFSKEGYEISNQVVNVGNVKDDKTRTFQLKKINTIPQVNTGPQASRSSSSPQFSDTTPTPQTTQGSLQYSNKPITDTSRNTYYLGNVEILDDGFMRIHYSSQKPCNQVGVLGGGTGPCIPSVTVPHFMLARCNNRSYSIDGKNWYKASQGEVFRIFLERACS